MELSSYTRNINDILTCKKTYIIPRFQREYSWEADELETLWNDIKECLKWNEDEKRFDISHYFFGSLVLIGRDSDAKLYVVDGQQRLTTITILLSVLSSKFGEIGQEDLRAGTFEYIKAKDRNNRGFLILESESPKPYFQYKVQYSSEENSTPSTDEEKRIEKAYNFFSNMLNKTNLIKEKLLKSKEDLDYLESLISIRDQILEFKTIYITVADEEDAYLIFETLNAKGKDLKPIDLVKNKILKSLPSDGNFDKPSEKWKEIKVNLKKRNKYIDTSTFFRHFWLAKYDFVTEGKIYESFLKKIPKDSKEDYAKLLNDLIEYSKIYSKLMSPDNSDWPQLEEKPIYDSITALNIFNVSQVNTILMALIKVRNKRLISFGRFKHAVKELEKFHFIFTAITHSRPSGLESKYSKYARNILNADSRDIVHEELDKLIKELQSKIPSEQDFEEKFLKVKYTSSNTKEKKLISYIMKKMEEYYRSTDELKFNQVSIEHIMPESTRNEGIGLIGNLLPFDKDINTTMGNKEYKEKLEYLKLSELRTVNKFIEEHGQKENWTEEDIEARTKEIARLFFKEIWE